MIIHPEVFATPDLPTVRFREPDIDLDIELPKVMHAQGWDCGTYFHVQFISHDRKKLMFTAKYVVVEVDESQHTNEDDPYKPVTRTICRRRAQQIGEVWRADEGVQVRWNPGKKLHQVIRDGQVIFEDTDKQKAVERAEAA